MGEGFRFRPPESERPEPKAKLSSEEVRTYDRSYWTPERISANLASFFERLERNEQRMRAERQRLLEQAIKEESEREAAEKVITEREIAEAESQRREDFKREIEETEALRQFRFTIEWMIEQSYDQIQELAMNFLQSSASAAKVDQKMPLVPRERRVHHF